MELVYVADCILPSRHAHAVQIVKMCRAFAKNGHDVSLLVPDRDGVDTDADDVYEFYGVEPCFEVLRLPRPNLSSAGTFLAAYRIGREAARRDPDLVYGRSLLACYFAAASGAQTVWEAHQPVDRHRFGRVQTLFFKHLLGRPEFRGVVVISDPLRAHFTDAYPLDDAEVVVAHDGADPVDETVEPAPLSGAGGGLQVGYVGHLYRGRGIELLLELGERLPEHDFHVVGGDPEDVDRWRDRRGDLDNVTFYGFVPPKELDPYRLAFDVQVAPYQRNLETGSGTNTVEWMSPLKVFEYMAAGRAIVASDLAAIRDILTDRRTALLCDPEEVGEWAATLERLEDDELREGLGRRARAEFLDNYTWRERARRILSAVTRRRAAAV